ncbi:MAG: DNA polymerase I [Oscillospiraceae bacterium]|nr:DNA polymerase I [Oscillospiraceae bacterium]
MKLMVLDGNSLINRAFYGIKPLSASDGTPTNAVYGFMNILLKLIGEDLPDALCVTFDLPDPTFRHEQYAEYKAQRKPMPDELRVQMPILKEVLGALNIPCVEQKGWEADDLLGTFAAKCETEGWECVIVTGDKDSLQLVTDLTHVKLVKTRMGQTETTEYTPAAFFEEYGFEPIKMIDLKALMGDASDNIPGVAGVGEKTAMELVQRFGSVKEVYAGLETLDIKDAVRKKLDAGREKAEMSYMLATIRTDAPVDITLQDSLRREPDNDRLYDILKRLGFSRLIDKLALAPSKLSSRAASAAVSPEIVEVVTHEDATTLLDAAGTADCVAVQLDIDYFDSIAVALPGGTRSFLLRRGSSDDFDETSKKLLGSGIRKAGHDIKEIMRACLERGIETGGWVFDTALAAYLLSPTDSSFSLPRISEQYLGYLPGAPVESGGQMTMLEDAAIPLAEYAYAIGLLKNTLSSDLKEADLAKLYDEIELPLCEVLAQMELCGFLVDKGGLVKYGEILSHGISAVEEQIHSLAGEDFNINSPKQLGTILFEKLMLPAPKKTKTGYSTNIEVLDQLVGKHPIIGQIKDYRELTKLKSTYVDGLLKVIGADGRIHTHFQMTVTATGRLSSTEPNLQNIPIRKEIGGELRKMFIAGAGNVLVDADYSQIELRILAHIANDPVMIAAFERGEDIHTVTASQVFGVPIEEVSSMQRGRAKAVNFGIVYGISAFSLANDIGVMPQEAKAYIDSYFEKYAGVREYMTGVIENAKKLGYVSTLFGRRRYLPELKSSNFNMRSFGERVALNMPIQGTAADVIKIAMVSISDKLASSGLKGRLILQVHDELIAECPEGEAEAVSRILREEMESVASLSVPLVADTRVGKSWFDAK